MGRAVTGSVRHRGARVQVTFDSVTFTCTEQFGDEDSAQAWRRAVAEALRHGRTPPAADRWRSSAVSAVAQPLTDEQRRRTLCQLVFDSLIMTRYEDRHDGGPERQKAVASYWINHVCPFLQRACKADRPSIQDLHHQLAHAFVMHLAGRGSVLAGADTAAPVDLWAVGGQDLTARQAAAQTDVSVPEINRLRRSGVLRPGVLVSPAAGPGRRQCRARPGTAGSSRTARWSGVATPRRPRGPVAAGEHLQPDRHNVVGITAHQPHRHVHRPRTQLGGAGLAGSAGRSTLRRRPGVRAASAQMSAASYSWAWLGGSTPVTRISTPPDR